jgi:hypothetical protein
LSDFKTLLNYLDTIAPLLPIIIFFLSKNKVLGGRLLLLFLVVQFLLNGIANIMAANEKNNITVYKINCFFSLIILSAYFLKLLKGKKRFWKFLFFSVILTLIQVFIILKEGNLAFDSTSFSYTSLIIFLYSLLYFANSIYEANQKQIIKTSAFWIVTGLFTYYASNFFIFILFAYYSSHNEPTILGLLWRIHNCIFFLMTLYMSKGLLCKDYPKML